MSFRGRIEKNWLPALSIAVVAISVLTAVFLLAGLAGYLPG
jgi:hypothetical protein